MALGFKDIYGQFKKSLREKGVSEQDAVFIEKQLEEKIRNERPPQIAIIGFTGVGKSSTLNALFNAGRPTSDVQACTQQASSVFGNIEPYTGSRGIVEIYDMPGLGEDIDKDPEFYKVYAEVLPKVDVIIWTFHASDRVMAPMQQAICQLQRMIGPDFTKKLLFAINKADTAAPGESDWNTKFNVPSELQKRNLYETETYIRKKVLRVLPNWNGPIVSYSAKYRYHLDQLMTAMIEVMPEKRRWVLNNLADVADFTDLIAPEYMNYIHSLRQKRGNNLE